MNPMEQSIAETRHQQKQQQRQPEPEMRLSPPSSVVDGEEKGEARGKISFRTQVVISGIAGRFPECDDVQALREALLRGEDLLTADDRRWSIDHPEIPPRSGKINGLEKFDASFFSVHFKQAHTMDPQCRLLLERAYEAIVDAGVNPRSLRGKKMGVYVGVCFSESEKTWFYEKLQLSGFGITGCCRAMLANRISYWLGVKGEFQKFRLRCLQRRCLRRVSRGHSALT
ncbi:Fatty acid synthase [Gryllus bimaculatus]|nr:Fatty acid synthase [Gryllus bimaculatus]